MLTNHAGLTRAALAAVLCIAVLPARLVFAQSLGDLARRSDEQKKEGTSKVYTNGNLGSSDQPSGAPAAPPAAATAAGEQPPSAAPATKPSGLVEEDKETGRTNTNAGTATNKRDEQYWRKTIGDLRAKVAVLNRDIALQQARLDQVQGESPTAVREREVISGTMERLQKDLALQTTELTRWLTRAGVAKVPEEWLK